MDEKQFEQLTRMMADGLTRRRAMQKLGAGLAVVGGLGFARRTGAQSQSGTTLSATKTATGYWERRITWTIDKQVNVDGNWVSNPNPDPVFSATSQPVPVEYRVVLDKSTNEVIGVRGQVCVTNGGAVTTQDLMLVDQVQYKIGAGKFQDLSGAKQTITPTQLAPGESKCYDYDIAFTPVAGAVYRNTVKVTILNHSGHLGESFGPEPKADFTLPASATTVGPDSVTVTDSAYGSLGSASDDAVLGPYTVNWGCNGTYSNTATITETGDSDSVTVKTQCSSTGLVYGCSAGYYKGHQFDLSGAKLTDKGFAAGKLTDFGLSTDLTFGQAVDQQYPNNVAYVWQAATAYLNAYYGLQNFPYTMDQIVAGFNDGTQNTDQLKEYNDGSLATGGCNLTFPKTKDSRAGTTRGQHGKKHAKKQDKKHGKKHRK